jgi:uncharacterized protein YndB with AHSA1/START domain
MNNATHSIADLGELDRTGQAWRLRFVRHLAHPQARVWRALTEPADLAAWFPSTIEGDRVAGAPLTFTFEHAEAAPMHGKMLACDPPRLLEFMWGTDQIRIELEPTATGTRLTLWDTLDANGKAARDGAGWHTCLDGLQALLDNPDSSDERRITDWADVHPLYQQAFGPEASTIGPPEGHPAAN